MAYDPEPGDVISYDFLWKEEELKGRTDGVKDRPCAVILLSETLEDGTRRILVAPITHTPPSIDDEQPGIELPYKVSRHLGLDDDKSWIKTHQINELVWVKDNIPFGVTTLKNGKWSYGRLPQQISKQVIEEVRKHSISNTLASVDRDAK